MEVPERRCFDRIADIYDDTRAVPEPYYSALLDGMEEHLDKREPILDFGMGTGRFARPLQARGYDVSGIDISKGMLRVGISKGLRNAILADASLTPFKDDSFHSTLSVHLLHLLPDWLNALKESIRVTTKNFITVQRIWLNDDTPYKLYGKITTEDGHLRETLGVSEKDFPEKVKPFAKEFLGSRKETVPADEGIQRCDDRIYSGMWGIADDVHQKAMRQVRQRFAGKEIVLEEEIFLLVWRIENLRKAVNDGVFEG
jgi:ubiquinone/menaquinone biosynthesis C-methylase UbiE